MLRFVAGKPGDLSDASLCFAIYMGFGFIFFSFGNSRLS